MSSQFSITNLSGIPLNIWLLRLLQPCHIISISITTIIITIIIIDYPKSDQRKRLTYGVQPFVRE